MSIEFSARVLFVDDDRSFLDAVARQFRNRFDLLTAEGGIRGLEAVNTAGPFQVVVSDMRMPDMNGIQFLSQVREISPDTIRIMLTGNADLDTAMHAVNEGNIFRFLIKPCQKVTMEWAIEAGFKQYQLVTAERELLEKTLKGSVQVLADTLALANPLAFSKASRLKEYVSQLVKFLKLEKSWEYELAALLSQIGCVAIPPDILEKVFSGTELSDEESKMFRSHPEFGAKLISLIPRLEDVSEMIAKQRLDFRDTGMTAEELLLDRIALGAHLLRISTEFDTMILSGQQHAQVLGNLKLRNGEFCPSLVRALEQVEIVDIDMEIREVSVRELSDSMVLAQDLKTKSGILVAPKGQKTTLSMRVRLENYVHRREIDAKVRVRMPSVKPSFSNQKPEVTVS